MSATVYAYFDADWWPLYVGITRRRTRRAREHSERDWWPDVATASFEHFESLGFALEREAELISRLCPQHNKQYPAHSLRIPAEYRILAQAQDGSISEQWLSRREEDLAWWNVQMTAPAGGRLMEGWGYLRAVRERWFDRRVTHRSILCAEGEPLLAHRSEFWAHLGIPAPTLTVPDDFSRRFD